MLYGNLDGTKIAGVVSAGKGYHHKTLTTVPLPETFQGVVGDDTRQFDENWKYLPISKQIESKVVTLDPHFKLDGETVVEKTVSEMVKDGTIILDERDKLVGEQIIPKTLEERVADGIEEIDPTKRAIGDELIDKTDAELMRDGLKKIPHGYKLQEIEKEVFLVQMTIDERLEAEQITSEQAVAEKNEIVRQQRKQAYHLEADPLNLLYQRGEATKEEWLAKIEEIKSRYPKETLQ